MADEKVTHERARVSDPQLSTLLVRAAGSSTLIDVTRESAWVIWYINTS